MHYLGRRRFDLARRKFQRRRVVWGRWLVPLGVGFQAVRWGPGCAGSGGRLRSVRKAVQWLCVSAPECCASGSRRRSRLRPNTALHRTSTAHRCLCSLGSLAGAALAGELGRWAACTVLARGVLTRLVERFCCGGRCVSLTCRRLSFGFWLCVVGSALRHRSERLRSGSARRVAVLGGQASGLVQAVRVRPRQAVPLGPVPQPLNEPGS